MSRACTIATVLVFGVFPTLGQILRSPERTAIRHMDKTRWVKAEELLRKAIGKDKVHVVARYWMSRYFFEPGNPGFRLDSAYHYAMGALSDLAVTSPKDREKVQKFALDSAVIVALRERIDSAVFEEVKAIDSEDAYVRFLEDHPFAPQTDEAIQRRNKVAYSGALQKNTYEAFLDFLTKYPNADEAEEARKKYERLLYETRTADNRLSSYQSFLKEYPETPFAAEIEKNIFELFTISGERERFAAFLKMYPNSPFVRKARSLLFHILDEESTPSKLIVLDDSLRHITSLQQSYLVPFLQHGKFGMMDKDGRVIINPVLDNLNEEYKCGNIVEDIVALPDRILARNGSPVYVGPVDEIDDLGVGFLKVMTPNGVKVVHKSGFVYDTRVEDARVLGKQFLAIRKRGHWTLQSLSGRQILPDEFDDITMHGEVVMLLQKNKWRLTTAKKVIDFVESRHLDLSSPYHEVRTLPQGRVWVRSDNREGLIDQKLREFIPLGEHRITTESFGFSVRSKNGIAFYSPNGKASATFADAVIREPWVVVSADNIWHLLNTERMDRADRGYDSVSFEGPFLLGILNDTLSVHFPGTAGSLMPGNVSTRFIPGRDSTSFLMIDIAGTKAVYGLDGTKLFTLTADDVQHAGSNIFIVSRKEKKGLVDASGTQLLPVEFDAVGTMSNDVISLLKDMKFGLYHSVQKKLIKPQYDKNLSPYRPNLITAYRDGRYGFVDWSNKPVVPFQFDEIRYWNDTVALVRQQSLWSLYDINNQNMVQSGIRSISFIRDTPQEKLAIVQMGSAYGVLSNTKGTVIPITFTDLVNVGSPDEPLYFTEKHVPEARVFVVIYYDRNGKFLRREIYEEPEDYEKIYCSGD